MSQDDFYRIQVAFGEKELRWQNIRQAPTILPTQVQFDQFQRLLSEIAPLGEEFGIVKIVPPSSWSPKFNLDPKKVVFNTKLETISEMNLLQRTARIWHDQLTNFTRLQRVQPLKNLDNLEPGVSLNLYKLHVKVRALGGYNAVVENGQWKQIITDTQGFVPTEFQINAISRMYRHDILPFECYVDKVKAADLQYEFAPNLKKRSNSEEVYNTSTTEADVQEEKLFDCAVCGLPGCTDMCRFCKQFFHDSCLEDTYIPPRRGVSWYCPKCLTFIKRYDHKLGGRYTLEQFQLKAWRKKNRYRELDLAKASSQQVEEEFWRRVDDYMHPYQVEYGTNVPCEVKDVGYAFPTSKEDAYYGLHEANLLNLNDPKSTSLLKHAREEMYGVTLPWAYIGSPFSAFCWHTEDHYLYSINYQHMGDIKTWYGIPAAHAEKFQEFSKRMTPEMFENDPDLFNDRRSLIAPDLIRDNGIDVFAVDQKPGEFVITFPQAYHQGFNHGFNYNEASNLAPPMWIKWGDMAVTHYFNWAHTWTFSHHELLWRVFEHEDNMDIKQLVSTYLEHAIVEELNFRTKLELSPQYDSLKVMKVPEKEMLENLEDEVYICSHCHSIPYFSRFALTDDDGDLYWVCPRCAFSRKRNPTFFRKCCFQIYIEKEDLKKALQACKLIRQS